jgi:hypothetical protein
MRNIKENFLKLLMLSAHLQAKSVNIKYPQNRFVHFVHNDIILFEEGDGIHHNMIYPFVIKELPNLFSEWTMVNDRVVYKPAPKLSDAFALCEFLGLEIEELFSICLPTRDSKYKVQELNGHARPADVGDRMFQFLESVLAELKVKTTIQTKNV